MSHPAIQQGSGSFGPVGHPFIRLKIVDSTNNYAMARVHEGLASHGMAVFTDHQTAGKGQRNKSWITGPGEAITISIILEPPSLTIQRQFELSMAIALACMDFFSKYIPDNLKIKWPNDLYWRDRKAGGILIENLFQGQAWRYAVAGIGLNINQGSFPSSLSNPVSLKQITGRHYDAGSLAIELCACVEKRWQQLLENNPASLLEQYNASLYKKNEIARLKKDNAVFETRILSVNLQGELLTSDTLERSFYFGEVQWVGNDG